MRDLLGTADARLPPAARWALRGLRLGLGLIVLVLALRAFSGASTAADVSTAGEPGWLMAVGALWLLAGALLLLIAPTAPYGAGLLAVALLGSVAVHLVHDPSKPPLLPCACLIVALAVMVAYRPPVLR
jgi:hypothetical protein